MKKGFTMIELIFVIVILGILAAVAIPRLAATRDDAGAAAIKTDVSTIIQAVPAWYQGQKDAHILKAVSIDTSKWVAGTGETYTWSDNSQACITVAVWDMNLSTDGTFTANGAAAITLAADPTTQTWTGSPVLRITKPTAAPTQTVCKMLWEDMGLTEQNISMGGQKVKW